MKEKIKISGHKLLLGVICFVVSFMVEYFCVRYYLFGDDCREQMFETVINNYSFTTAIFLGLILYVLARGIINVVNYIRTTEVKRENADICFGGIIFVGGIIFSTIWMIVTGNKFQKYTDIIFETTSGTATNKSPERALPYALILLGIVLYTLYYYWREKRTVVRDMEIITNKSFTNINDIIISSLGVVISSWFIFYTNISDVLVITSILVFFVYFKYPEILWEALSFYFLLIYAEIGIYRLYVILEGRLSISSTLLCIIAAIVTIGIVFTQKNKEKICQISFIPQLFIPFILLNLLQNQYLEYGGYRTIEVPYRITLLVWILIVFFVLNLLYVILKRKKDMSKGNSITIGTLITIFFTNCYRNSGAIMSGDLHHAFEDVIGFSQIFEKSLQPYEEYISASGFYSVLQGAFFKFAGKGLFSNLNVANNVYFLFIALALVVTLCLHLDRKSVLCVGILFSISDYNRVHLIIPIVLILIYPKLIEKTNSWLKVWVLSSFLHGLYYPTYGAAVCLGFMPLGIYQVSRYIKSGELKKDVKKVRFWLGWIVCILPIIAGLNILWGTFLHVKSMAEQTIYADGIVKFSQTILSGVMNYLSFFPGIRMACVNSIAFVVPVFLVLIVYFCVLSIGKIQINNKKVIIQNKQNLCCMSSLIIILLIAYTFTFIRLDSASLFARNTYMLLTICTLLFIFSLIYLEDKLKKFVICVAVAIPSIWGGVAIHNIDSSLQAQFTIPENYIYVENDKISKWGKGYVQKNIYDSVEAEYSKMSNDSKKTFYYGTMPSFGYYYLCDVKAVGTLEYGLTVKGYTATEEAVNLLRRHPSIVGGYGDIYTGSYAFYNYYLYNWLLTSGEYIWSTERDAFIPNINKLSIDEVREINKNIATIPENFNMGLHANSIGRSFASLDERFEKKDILYNCTYDNEIYSIEFEEVINGDEVDYVYVEFGNLNLEPYYCYFNVGAEEEINSLLEQFLLQKRYNKGMQLYIEWSDDYGKSHRVYAEMNDGKLLIPLGAGAKWLLHNHEGVDIGVVKDGAPIEIPEITEIRFLKLKEVK